MGTFKGGKKKQKRDGEVLEKEKPGKKGHGAASATNNPGGRKQVPPAKGD